MSVVSNCTSPSKIEVYSDSQSPLRGRANRDGPLLHDPPNVPRSPAQIKLMHVVFFLTDVWLSAKKDRKSMKSLTWLLMHMAGRVVVDKMKMVDPLSLIRAEADALFQQHVSDQKEITNRMNSERMRTEMALSDALKSKKTKVSSTSQPLQASKDHSFTGRDDEAALSARTTPVKQSEPARTTPVKQGGSDSHARHANNHLSSAQSLRDKQGQSNDGMVQTKPKKTFSLVHILINVIVVVIVIAPYAAGSLRMVLGYEASVLPRIY
jgi:hypothetical protein